MPGPKDSFDPTWKMPSPNDSRAGDYAAPETAPSGSQGPSVIARKGDGTANLGTTTVTKHNTEVPSGGQSEQNKWPGGVSKFDPINLTPGPKHPHSGKFDHSADVGV